MYTHHRSVKSADELLYNEMTNHLIGHLADYLATKARVRCVESAPFISWTTLSCYFSSFKNLFINKYHDKPVLSVLSVEKTKI